MVMNIMLMVNICNDDNDDDRLPQKKMHCSQWRCRHLCEPGNYLDYKNDVKKIFDQKTEICTVEEG